MPCLPASSYAYDVACEYEHTHSRFMNGKDLGGSDSFKVTQRLRACTVCMHACVCVCKHACACASMLRHVGMHARAHVNSKHMHADVRARMQALLYIAFSLMLLGLRNFAYIQAAKPRKQWGLIALLKRRWLHRPRLHHLHGVHSLKS